MLLRDVGLEREAGEALNLSTARACSLTEASPVAMMVENATGEVEIANEALCRLLGLKERAPSLAGVSVSDVLAKSTVKNAASLLARTHRRGRQSAGAVWRAEGYEDRPARRREGRRRDRLIEKIGMERPLRWRALRHHHPCAAARIRSGARRPLPAHRTSTETAVAAIGDIIDSRRSGARGAAQDAVLAARGTVGPQRLGPNAEEHDCRLRVKVEQDVTDSLEGDVSACSSS